GRASAHRPRSVGRTRAIRRPTRLHRGGRDTRVSARTVGRNEAPRQGSCGRVRLAERRAPFRSAAQAKPDERSIAGGTDATDEGGTLMLTGLTLSWSTWILLTTSVALALVATRRITMAVRTLRASALTPRLSRWLSGWVRPMSYSDERFFRADGATDAWVERRKAGIDRLCETLEARSPHSRAWSNRIRGGLSDLRFT